MTDTSAAHSITSKCYQIKTRLDVCVYVGVGGLMVIVHFISREAQWSGRSQTRSLLLPLIRAEIIESDGTKRAISLKKKIHFAPTYAAFYFIIIIF